MGLISCGTKLFKQVKIRMRQAQDMGRPQQDKYSPWEPRSEGRAGGGQVETASESSHGPHTPMRTDEADGSATPQSGPPRSPFSSDGRFEGGRESELDTPHAPGSAPREVPRWLTDWRLKLALSSESLLQVPTPRVAYSGSGFPPVCLVRLQAPRWCCLLRLRVPPPPWCCLFKLRTPPCSILRVPGSKCCLYVAFCLYLALSPEPLLLSCLAVPVQAAPLLGLS